MEPISPISRLQQYISPPIDMLRTWLTPARRRTIWRAITIISLILMGIGLLYAWRELPERDFQVRPVFFGLALAVYVVTYAMHVFGWHALTRLYLGHLAFRSNLEAIAASSLVKRLPTIAWYIANRTHYYERRNISRSSVVAASLVELALMIGAGAAFYLTFWGVRRGMFLETLGLVVVIAVLLISICSYDSRVTVWIRATLARLMRWERASHSLRHWLVATGWYAGSWIVGVWFLWAVINAFVPMAWTTAPALFEMWLLAGLTGYIVSITLGSIGIARELTLTVILGQLIPLPAAIATAIMVKILLTAGEVGCSLLVLGSMRIITRRG